jgi:hypothetical protein
MENHFKGFTVEYIERSENPKATELVMDAVHNTPLPRLINLIEGEDWHAPIMACLHHYYEPDHTTEHIRMLMHTKQLTMIYIKPLSPVPFSDA